MLRYLDAVPGVAGDDPTFGGFVLQWIEIFRLASQEADDRAVLEQAASIALTHQLYEIGAERNVEDGFRICSSDSLHQGTGIDLALRRPLLLNPLDVGSLFRHQFLEDGHSRLAVFIVRRDRRPTFGGQL